MSFLNPDSEKSSMTIHERTYTWSGGSKKDPNDPDVSRIYVRIGYYEGRGEDAVKGDLGDTTTMKLAIIGHTYQLTGWDKPTGTSYRSNETSTKMWGIPFSLTSYFNGASKHVGTGSYDELKKICPASLHPQKNVYFYNFDVQRIERLQLKGSSYQPFKTYLARLGKGQLYTGWTIMSPGEKVTFEAGSSAIVPKFELGITYTPEEMEILRGIAVKMDEYEAYLEEFTTKRDNGDFDKMPPIVGGLESENIPDAPAVNPAPLNQADLSDVPF